MGDLVSFQGYKAMLRLTKMHQQREQHRYQAQCVLEEIGKDIRGESEPYVLSFFEVPIISVSLEDIGMNNIEELIETFKEYDAAIAQRDFKKIMDYYAILMGEEKSNIKFV